MGFENILVEKRDRVGKVILNRPPYNVINIATMREMIQAIEELDKDQETKVIILAASGDKAFCTGVDVKDHMPETFQEMAQLFDQLLRLLAAPMGKPRIAVVRGMCSGGGWEVVMYCDMVIASEKSRFAQPEIQVGLVGGPAAALMPRLIGRKKALEILLSGDWIDAKEAERIGMVNKVVPEDGLDEAVDEFIRRFTDKSLIALKLARYATYRAFDLELGKALETINDIYVGLMMHTEDALEGLSAFLEKRKPVWKDK